MEWPYLVPLALLAIFCLWLLLSPASLARARENLVRLGRGRPRTSVQAAAGALVLIAVAASSMQLTARFVARAPEALSLLPPLGSSVAVIAATAAGFLWIWGAEGAALSPRADLRLSEAARRLELSTEETLMRAIDAGLRRLEAGGDTGSRSRQGR